MQRGSNRSRSSGRRSNRTPAEANQMMLERVIGFTVTNNSTVSLDPTSGILAYPAGCVVVCYLPKRSRQFFLHNSAKSPITTLAFSRDGKLLATGESSKNPKVRIWNVENRTQVMELSAGHTYKVSVLAFSPNSRYLVSMGSPEDTTINVWDIAGAASNNSYGNMTTAAATGANVTGSNIGMNSISSLSGLGHPAPVPTGLGLGSPGVTAIANGIKVGSGKVTSRINAIAYSDTGHFFVTVGVRHVRFWFWDCSIDTKSIRGTKALVGRNPILKNEKGSVFTDVAIHSVGLGSMTGSFYGAMSSGVSSSPVYTYVVSQNGKLIRFNESRFMDQVIELQTSKAACIAVNDSYVVIGCGNSVVLVFETVSLNYLFQLPKPHYQGIPIPMSEPYSTDQKVAICKYPDVIACKHDNVHSRIACFYSDHSLYVWDVRDPKHPIKISSHLHHSGGVWSVESVKHNHNNNHPQKPQQQQQQQQQRQQCKDNNIPPILEVSSFITCSEDETVRFWNLPSVDILLSSAHNNSNSNNNSNNIAATSSSGGGAGAGGTGVPTEWQNEYSKDLVKIIYTDPQLRCLTETGRFAGRKNCGNENSQICRQGIRSIKVSPNGDHLAVADRYGNLRFYSLFDFNELYTVQAHSGEILTIDYFQSPTEPGFVLFCSSSRDRLIHIMDPANQYRCIQTLDDHSGAIFGARVVETPADQEIRLVSCGMDRSLLFRILQPDETGQTAQFFLNQHLVSKYSQYDMAILPNRRYAVVACQDRKVRTYNLVTGKQRRCYRGSLTDDGVLTRCVVDPTGTYLSTVGSDKWVHLMDVSTGDIICSAAGHSEPILGLCFLDDLRRLVTVSADSCIFVWRLPPSVSNTMYHRQWGGAYPSTNSTNVGVCSSSMPAGVNNQPVFASSSFAHGADTPYSIETMSECSVPPTPPIFQETVGSNLPTTRLIPTPSATSSNNVNGVAKDTSMQISKMDESAIRKTQTSFHSQITTTSSNSNISMNGSNIDTSFRFSVSALPSWAQKKVNMVNEYCGLGSISTVVETNTSICPDKDAAQLDPKEMTKSTNSTSMTARRMSFIATEKVVRNDDSDNMEPDDESELMSPMVDKIPQFSTMDLNANYDDDLEDHDMLADDFEENDTRTSEGEVTSNTVTLSAATTAPKAVPIKKQIYKSNRSNSAECSGGGVLGGSTGIGVSSGSDVYISHKMSSSSYVAQSSPDREGDDIMSTSAPSYYNSWLHNSGSSHNEGDIEHSEQCSDMHNTNCSEGTLYSYDDCMSQSYNESVSSSDVHKNVIPSNSMAATRSSVVNFSFDESATGSAISKKVKTSTDKENDHVQSTELNTNRLDRRGPKKAQSEYNVNYIANTSCCPSKSAAGPTSSTALKQNHNNSQPAAGTTFGCGQHTKSRSESIKERKGFKPHPTASAIRKTSGNLSKSVSVSSVALGTESSSSSAVVQRSTTNLATASTSASRARSSAGATLTPTPTRRPSASNTNVSVNSSLTPRTRWADLRKKKPLTRDHRQTCPINMPVSTPSAAAAAAAAAGSGVVSARSSVSTAISTVTGPKPHSVSVSGDAQFTAVATAGVTRTATKCISAAAKPREHVIDDMYGMGAGAASPSLSERSSSVVDDMFKLLTPKNEQTCEAMLNKESISQEWISNFCSNKTREELVDVLVAMLQYSLERGDWDNGDADNATAQQQQQQQQLEVTASSRSIGGNVTDDSAESVGAISAGGGGVGCGRIASLNLIREIESATRQLRLRSNLTGDFEETLIRDIGEKIVDEVKRRMSESI